MRKSPISFGKYFIVLLFCLFVFGGVPVEFAEDKSFFHGYVIPKPIIRVGLGVNLSDIQISSSSGVKVYEVKENYKLIADNVDEVWIKGSKGKLNEKFMVQVAQSERKEEMEIFAQELRTKVGNKVSVRRIDEKIADTYQVRVGDFRTRQDALSFIKELSQFDIEDSWILREEITEEESKPLWILVEDVIKNLDDDTVLYFIPSHARSFLSYKGRNYRGIFVLKASRKGVVLINILNLDDYLKGVVPSELSPYSFRELEAHKAQAVAARTYAIKNLGLYEELGFDLDDTPNSQFYKGMNAEHPLSSSAVDITQGEVALYKGKLIDALYTSTCGGMTENVEEIFNGPALPYLRSTECVYEKQRGYSIENGQSILPVYIQGKNISPQIAFLSSLGIIPEKTDPVFFNEKISYQEAKQWIGHAASALGKKGGPADGDGSGLNLQTLAQMIVDSFQWQERVENLMFPSEKDFVLMDVNGGDADRLDEVAYLIQTGIFALPNKEQNTQRAISRGELIIYLYRSILSSKDPAERGVFKSLSKDGVHVDVEGEEKSFSLSPETFLLINSGGDYHFAPDVFLIGGEEIRWFAEEGQAKYLEIIDLPQTDILDRSSSQRSWKERKSKKVLERRINQFYPIGQLLDIIPQERGISNRVVRLLISGSESQAVVEGLQVRRVLGLKETLFVIDREYDDSGDITHFDFLGRGWGHGVGLCQVGAYGMARAGADYKEILKKYYRGITIGKIY